MNTITKTGIAKESGRATALVNEGGKLRFRKMTDVPSGVICNSIHARITICSMLLDKMRAA